MRALLLFRAPSRDARPFSDVQGLLASILFCTAQTSHMMKEQGQGTSGLGHCHPAETQNELSGFPKAALCLEKPSCHHVGMQSLSLKECGPPSVPGSWQELLPEQKVTPAAPGAEGKAGWKQHL